MNKSTLERFSLLLLILLSIESSFGQYTTLINFAGATNGKTPRGSLISDGTYLYGMTQLGGVNNMGTIFKVLADGTGYEKILDFDGTTNGSEPTSDLIYDGTYLYGTTYWGGINNMGTVFKIKPDGTGYLKLLDFQGISNGRNPNCTLYNDGTYLFGSTYYGGSNDHGTIFRIMPDGTGYLKLIDFIGPSEGRFPIGKFISDGSYLYGMTVQGGTNDKGTIFKIMPNGTGFVKLFDFIDGQCPFGSLVSDGTYMYGTTYFGGAFNKGIIFKILPNGSGYVKLLNFQGPSNGSFSDCSLIYDGTFLYGMTEYGGMNNEGVVFKILPNGTGYDKLVDLGGGGKGSIPYGSLFSDGNFLYGMTSQGGTNDFGTLFKVCIAPPIVSATNTGPYCAGSTIGLNAIGSDTYIWSGPNSFTSSLQNPNLQAVEISTGGMYTVTSSNSIGCYSSASTNVIVDSLPVASNNGEYCVGTSIQLNGFGGGNYEWSGPLSFSDTLQNPIITSVTETMSGNYILTTTNACGINTDTTSVIVNPLPLAVASNTGPYCVWQPIQLNASGGVSYSWIGPYSFSSALQNPSITAATMPMNGTYFVTVTDAEGCVATTSTDITINVCAGLDNISKLGFTIYPNPTSDSVTILSSENIQQNLIISNIFGEMIIHQEIKLTVDTPIIVDLSNNPTGIYFLRIGNSVQKIIKQ